MSDEIALKACSLYRTRKQKVQNKDIRALDARRCVQGAHYGHSDHLCNGSPAAGLALRGQGTNSKCEIPYIW